MFDILILDNLNHLDINEDFKSFLKEEKVPRPYNYSYARNVITIYFYEWSRMDKGFKSFNDKDAFKKFLKDCNISFTKEDETNLDNCVSYCYCSCFPNEARLAFSHTYYGLRDKLNLKPCTSLAKL